MEWENNNKQLTRTFHFADFKQALNFVNRVGKLAEAAQHHPEILIAYNQVTLTLVTHETGDLTSKDFDLAEKIAKVAEEYLGPLA